MLDFVLGPEFVVLRPFSAATQFQTEDLFQEVAVVDASHAQRAFDRAATLFMDLSRRTAVLGRGDLLRIHACLAMMFGVVFSGVDVSGSWLDLFRDARRAGLLGNPQLRMQLSAMGSWAGSPGPYVQWLVDTRSRDFELADTYAFVRDDAPEELLDRTARLIRGEHVDPTSCLARHSPASTLKAAMGYTTACMRDPAHLSTAGHAIALLTMIEDVQRHVSHLRRRGTLSKGIPGWEGVLRRVDTVQQLEKQRFIRVLETLPAGHTRRRLTELWERDVLIDRMTSGAAARWTEPV